MEKLQDHSPDLRCSRCGKPLKLATSMSDPRSGQKIRIFECRCGERIWLDDKA